MRSRIIIVLASVVWAFCLFASSALASSGVPIPGTVTANANATLTDLALKRVNQSGSLVVYDEQIKVAKRESGCRWYNHFTNSSYVVGSYHGSHIVGYPDAHGYLCRDSHSPTGYVKRGGGSTGRDCRNIAAPPNKAVPFPVFRGKLVSFASKSEVKIKVHANAAIHTVLDLWCGHFEGSAVAEDNVWIRLTTYVKLKSRNSKMKFFAKFFVKAADKVSQNVSFSCSFTPPPPPPPPPPTSTPTPTPSPTPTPTPPPKVKVKLVKFCFVDGDKVECPKDFGFSVNGNGGFTNSGGEVTNLVEVNSGTQVTVCETDPKGWTRDDDQCQTVTATGSYATVTFKNKKVTPPPPKAHANLVRMVTVTLTNTGNADAVNVAVEVTGASNSPASFTIHPGPPLTPTFSTTTDIDVHVRAMFGSNTLFDQTFPKCEKPPTPPTVKNVTQPQEVYVNETYPVNICADVTSPAGDTVKVVFGARFGIGFTKTITSTGSDRVCGTYTAPTDLPFVWTPPSWSGFSHADTWEQVHVVATDLDTALSSTSSKNPPEDIESYVWFPIIRPPANP
jgi:hypothetical protein